MRDVRLEKTGETRKIASLSDPGRLAKLVNEVYWLALRMLWHPADAERATQAILLGSFDDVPSEAPLRARVLRSAVKYLLNAQASPFERQAWTFDSLADDLRRGADEPLPGSLPSSQRHALVQELQIGCTQAMLLCLDREQRISYLLGEVSSLNEEAAGYILDISPQAFCEKLQRARERVASFMNGHCGLLNPDRPCRCSQRLGRALQTGRVDRRQLLFVLPVLPASSADAERPRANPSLVFREQPLRPAPPVILDQIRAKLIGPTPSSFATSSRRRHRMGRPSSAHALSLALSLTPRAKARR